MATISWTLEVAGVVRTFAAWNASIPSINFRSLDEDTAQFVVTGDITASCPIVYGNRIRIFRRVDAGTPVCWFVGSVTGVTARGTPQIQEWTIRCTNFWFGLSQTMFQQTLVCYDVSGCAKLTNKKTTKVVLFQDERTGARITTGTQIRQAIAAAQAAGVTVDVGTVPEFVNAAFEVARDLTLMDVIRRAMQFTPDAVSWVDYSSGATMVNFQQRVSLSATSLSVTASPSIIESFELRRRDDLVPTGVRFNYIGMGAACSAIVPNGCVDDTSGQTNTTGGPITADAPDQLARLTQDTSGIVTTAGAIIGTFDLTQMTEGTTETAPTGLASQYYISLLTPQWEGEVVTVEPECSGTLRPGKVLNITGGNADWTSMRAVIQQVTENLEKGETSVTLGLPEHLGPQDFITFIQMTRRRPLFQSSLPVTRPPGADDTNCLAGKDADAQKLLNALAGNPKAAGRAVTPGVTDAIPSTTLEVCQDGAPTTIAVLTPSA